MIHKNPAHTQIIKCTQVLQPGFAYRKHTQIHTRPFLKVWNCEKMISVWFLRLRLPSGQFYAATVRAKNLDLVRQSATIVEVWMCFFWLRYKRFTIRTDTTLIKSMWHGLQMPLNYHCTTTASKWHAPRLDACANKASITTEIFASEQMSEFWVAKRPKGNAAGTALPCHYLQVSFQDYLWRHECSDWG